MIKNIVFDLDGTLLDTKLVDSIVARKLFEDYGVPRSTTEKFYTLLKFQPFQIGVSSVVHRKYLWRFATNVKSEIGNHYYEWWENTRRKTIEQTFGLFWLLDDLESEGFNIFIATSGDTYTQSMKLACMNVNYSFFVFDQQNKFNKTGMSSWGAFFRLFEIEKNTLVVGDDFFNDVFFPIQMGKMGAVAKWYNNENDDAKYMREGEIKSFYDCEEFFDYCLTLK